MARAQHRASVFVALGGVLVALLVCKAQIPRCICQLHHVVGRSEIISNSSKQPSCNKFCESYIWRQEILIGEQERCRDGEN
jgi:hypothetical protein